MISIIFTLKLTYTYKYLSSFNFKKHFTVTILLHLYINNPAMFNNGERQNRENSTEDQEIITLLQAAINNSQNNVCVYIYHDLLNFTI